MSLTTSLQQVEKYNKVVEALCELCLWSKVLLLTIEEM